ncbi:YaiI/YqxD family protein [Desulfoluna sp.]|uniref:YaiI/YqxD family protein n=1 Tax=Desulfoluna sp. TaxID=2045199 RepID=UPI0026382744|nr:YaiI/YqxD family protein [Desulfoluna sp.]
MTLYIDGDAFPNLLKPVLLRAINRLEIPTVVVANKRITLGPSKHITYILVSAGADEADHRIVELVKEGELVITADIPLADRVITKKAHAINHRGEMFTAENIKDILSMRNLMQGFRDCGEFTKGPAPLNHKDVSKFANKLNQFCNNPKAFA